MKRILSIVLAVVIVCSTFAGAGITANAFTEQTTAPDPEVGGYYNNIYNRYWNGSYATSGNCTWYAFGRAQEIIGGSITPYSANAKDWFGVFGQTYPTDQTPSPGSVVCWGSSNGGYGHVAVVEGVNADGTIRISESCYGGPWFNYFSSVDPYTFRKASYGYVFQGYIHFKCVEHSWDAGVITKQPTCKKNGEKTYTCVRCGETKIETVKKDAQYHQYKVVSTKKATVYTNGTLKQKCTICGNTVKSTIYRPKGVRVDTTKMEYNGSAFKPSVTIMDVKGKIFKAKYYSLKYKNNKNVGYASVLVTLKGRYMGAYLRKFEIVPKKTTLEKLSAGRQAFTATWKKQTTQTGGYQIQYATNEKFSKNKKTVELTKNTVTSKKISGLKGETTYYVRVRTFKKVNGTKHYSSWSNVQSVKTGSAALSLIKIKDGVKYLYDINADGKKETIIAKTVKQYGSGGYHGATERYIYVNGVKRMQGQGYKAVNFWLVTDKTKAVVINQARAGTPGTNMYCFEYSGKKYHCRSLSDMAYYFESPAIVNGNFEIRYAPHYNWSNFTSMQGFTDYTELGGWSFEVAKRFKLSGAKLVQVTDTPYTRGSHAYVAGNTFYSGKTIESIGSGDGPLVYKGQVISILNVVTKGSDYYFKFLLNDQYGWFKSSGNIKLAANVGQITNLKKKYYYRPNATTSGGYVSALITFDHVIADGFVLRGYYSDTYYTDTYASNNLYEPKYISSIRLCNKICFRPYKDVFGTRIYGEWQTLLDIHDYDIKKCKNITSVSESKFASLSKGYSYFS